jgi:HTH-type transcriptional regulator/antitoxin HipB
MMSSMKDKMLRNAEQLGATIRLRRKEKGFSQSRLADLLGVERKWVLRLEAGNPKAALGLVLKTLHALNLRAFLSDEDQHAPTSRLDEVFVRLQRPVRK